MTRKGILNGRRDDGYLRDDTGLIRSFWYTVENERLSCGCGCGKLANFGKEFIQGHHLKTLEGRELARANGYKTGFSPQNILHLQSERMRKITSVAGKKTASKPETQARLHSLEWRIQAHINSTRPEHVERLLKWTNSPENIARMKSPEMRALHSIDAKRPENIRRLLSIKHEKPTHLEQRVFALTQYYDLPFDFVGDGTLLIGGQTDGKSRSGYKCPDFVHQTEKVLVEVANESDKRRTDGGRSKAYESKEVYENSRTTFFGKYGYKVLFLWSDYPDSKMVEILRGVAS